MQTLKRVLLILIAAWLLNLLLLTITGFLRDNKDSLAQVHQIAGQLMLGLAAITTLLWLVVNVPQFKDRPSRFLASLIFVMALSLATLLNTFTGYLRPNKIETNIDRETLIRFQVLHQGALPVLVAIMLLSWLRRLTGGEVQCPK